MINTSVGAVSSDYIFGNNLTPLYNYLISLQNDITSVDLKTDAEYLQQFVTAFNTDELWYSDQYVNLVEFILSELNSVTFPYTHHAISIYDRMAFIKFTDDGINEDVAVLDFFVGSVSNPQSINVRNTLNNINNAVDQISADKSLFKLISNPSELLSSDVDYALSTIYQLDKRFTPANNEYYLSITDSIKDNNIIFSSEFLTEYMGEYCDNIEAELVTLITEFDAYFNEVLEYDTFPIGYCYPVHQLFAGELVKILDYYNTVVRPIVFTTKQFLIEGNYSNNIIQTTSDILTSFDIALFINNIYVTAISTCENLSEVNIGAVNDALDRINANLLNNKSPSEVEGISTLIEYSIIESNKSSQIGTSGNSLMNYITPEMMNNPNTSLVTGAVGVLNTKTTALASNLQTEYNDLLILRGSVATSIGYINSIIRNYTTANDLNSINENINFINSLSNLKLDLSILTRFLNKAICNILNMLCLVRKLASEALSYLEAVKSLGGSLADQAQALYDSVSAKLKSFHKTLMSIELASKRSELIGAKLEAIAASVETALGPDKAAVFRTCYSKQMNNLPDLAGIVGPEVDAYFTSLEASLIALYQGVISGTKCVSKANLPGIVFPNRLFNTLDFKLPKITIGSLNCA